MPNMNKISEKIRAEVMCRAILYNKNQKNIDKQISIGYNIYE